MQLNPEDEEQRNVGNARLRHEKNSENIMKRPCQTYFEQMISNFKPAALEVSLWCTYLLWLFSSFWFAQASNEQSLRTLGR